MKKTLLASVLLISCLVLKAQSPSWIWAEQATGQGNSHSQCIAADSYGNTYILGGFCNTLQVGNFTLPSNTCGNVYIAKYDPNGNVIWAQWLFMGEGFAITTDLFDNVYLTGRLGNNCSIGGYSFIVQGSSDIIIVKLTPAGNVLWAEEAGGNGLGWEDGHGIITDALGDCYITGTFTDSAFFGNTILKSAGLGDYGVQWRDRGNVECGTASEKGHCGDQRRLFRWRGECGR